MTDILSLAEAASRLGISPTTLRHAAQSGTLDAKRIGNSWATTPAAVERYRAERLGRVGRPPRK